MNERKIEFHVPDASFAQLERYRIIIHGLIMKGAFNIRNGNVVLSFHEHNLASIKMEYFPWRRERDGPLLPEGVVTDTITLDKRIPSLTT